MADSTWAYHQPQPDSGYFSPHNDMSSLQFHFDESLQDHQEMLATTRQSDGDQSGLVGSFEPEVTSTPALAIHQGQIYCRRLHRSDSELYVSRPADNRLPSAYHSHGHLCQPQVIYVGSAHIATEDTGSQTSNDFRCANCMSNSSGDSPANRPTAVVAPNAQPTAYRRRRDAQLGVPMDPAQLQVANTVGLQLAQIGDQFNLDQPQQEGIVVRIQTFLGAFLPTWMT